MKGLYEGIMGVKRGYDGLEITPCFPKEWERAEMTRHFRNADYHIVIENPQCRKAVTSLPHCQVMNSRKRQPQRKIFVAAVLIGGLKQKNPRLYQGNKNFSIA